MGRKKEESVEALAPDPFLEAAKRWSGWIEKRLKVFIAIFAFGLAAIGGYEFFRSQDERDDSRVTSKLGDAVKAYEEVVEPSRIMSSTIAAALDPGMEQARRAFAAFSKEYPAHGATQLARLYEADLARRMGKHSDAELLYRAYVGVASPDDALLFIALEGVGYALEEQGKLDEAIEAYSELGQGGTSFYKDFALKHRARVFEKKGDVKAAIAAYEAIVAIDPPSPLRAQAEEKLKILK